MDYDLIFVIGLVVLILAIPTVFSAIADGRAPRTAAIMIMIGGGLVATAAMQKPNGYTISDIPNAFVTVVGRYIN